MVGRFRKSTYAEKDWKQILPYWKRQNDKELNFQMEDFATNSKIINEIL
jgi:hypothetical protein